MESRFLARSDLTVKRPAENERELLRPMHPEPRLLALLAGVHVSVDVHGEVHLDVEHHQPGIHRAHRQGEQEDGRWSGCRDPGLLGYAVKLR